MYDIKGGPGVSVRANRQPVCDCARWHNVAPQFSIALCAQVQVGFVLKNVNPPASTTAGNAGGRLGRYTPASHGLQEGRDLGSNAASGREADLSAPTGAWSTYALPLA